MKSLIEKAPLIGKPPSKEAQARGAPDWSKAKVREASSDDVDTIASWVQGEREKKWLGATPDVPIQPQIKEWITNSLGAFLIHHSDSQDGKPSPVAFANVAPFGSDTGLEIGRLVVAPVQRRRGFGTTLLRHLAASITNNRTAAEAGYKKIHIRAFADNDYALSMIKSLPFEEDSAPLWVLAADAGCCRWFIYRIYARASFLGSEIRRFRKLATPSLSQSDLAFQAGVTRTTINMIESERRNPSIEVLQTLACVLGHRQLDRVRLLLSAIGEKPEPWLRADGPLDRHHEDPNANMWIISDQIAEAIDPAGFLEDSKQAIRNGYDRWYFIPPGQLGKLLVGLFKDSGISSDVLDKRLRFYEAPSLLCDLRIAIRNPGILSVESVTIEGEGGGRVPLGQDRATALVLSVRLIVTTLELASHRDSSIEGFRRLFPEVRTDEQAA